LLGVFFLIHGGFKLALTSAWRRRPGWGWLAASAVISVLLGILVLAGLPGTAAWAIGLILGVDLLFTGVTLLILGFKLKQAAGGRPGS
jgi:uncharacterized membrane protein HdeD (DUF308 family)